MTTTDRRQFLRTLVLGGLAAPAVGKTILTGGWFEDPHAYKANALHISHWTQTARVSRFISDDYMALLDKLYSMKPVDTNFIWCDSKTAAQIERAVKNYKFQL